MITEQSKTKVIVRSNNDEPFLVGELVRFDKIKSSSVPVVTDENGKEWLCCGIVIPYDEKVIEILNKMNPTEQWEWLQKICLGFNIIRSGDEVSLSVYGKDWKN